MNPSASSEPAAPDSARTAASVLALHRPGAIAPDPIIASIPRLPSDTSLSASDGAARVVVSSDAPISSYTTSLKVYWGVIIVATVAVFAVRVHAMPGVLLCWTLPLLALHHWRQREETLSSLVPLPQVLHTFALGFLGAVLASIVESVVVLVGLALASRFVDVRDYLPDTEATSKLHVSVFLILALLFMAFVVAGLVEESLKLLVGSRARPRTPEAVIYLTVVGALGFSTIENTMYVASSSTVGGALLLALGRIFLSAPLHCLTGQIIGCGIVRKHVFLEPSDWTTVKHMAVAVFLHGLFDFCLFLAAVVWLGDDELANTIIALSIGLVILSITALVSVAMRHSVLSRRVSGFTQLGQRDDDLELGALPSSEPASEEEEDREQL